MPSQDPAWLLASGDFFFRWRNAVFPAVIVLSCLLLPPVRSFGSDVADTLLDGLGIVAVLAGLALRAAVIGYAYIRRGGVNKKVYADRLVTAGFFAVSRNPLYVGNLLVYGGLLSIHSNPWSVMLGGGFFLFAYRAIVATEERYLRRTFGADYESYCLRTPRWWPRWSGLRAALDGMEFRWRRVIAKDYSTATPALLCVLLLLGLETLRWQAWPPRGLGMATLIGLAIVVAMCGLFARIAKKSGALHD